MAVTAYEVNFDGIVGPTHHYGGLSAGNVASQLHRHEVSHPKQAALQGLEKMKLLVDLGLKQGVLPPHERPHMGRLRRDFAGTDREVVEQAAQQRPELLSRAYSAAAMWAANAATVSPGADTSDGRVHFTPANLISTAHRCLEAEFTTRVLRTLFPDGSTFAVHDPLPPESNRLSDEGAANHMRVCAAHGQPGIEVFVYGRRASGPNERLPRRYPARQTKEACERIITRHQLSSNAYILVQQNPEAIDAGVFHNDVIAVANENVLFCHELAYVEQERFLRNLRSEFEYELQVIEVDDNEVPLEEAVRTYLFNSQLLTMPDGEMLLLCPVECRDSPVVREKLEQVVGAENRISRVQFVDVRQSMQNGGGPACLRLRVVLTEEQLQQVHSAIWLTAELYDELRAWVVRHYRDELTAADLRDPQLMDEVRAALNDLSGILELGAIYPFQR